MESLIDSKRVPIFTADKISSLEEIGIYTYEKDTPLKEVFLRIYDKENGNSTSVAPKASTKELQAYFAQILDNFDRERVYPSDIKKVMSWYNLLLSKGVICKEDHGDTPEVVEPSTDDI